MPRDGVRVFVLVRPVRSGQSDCAADGRPRPAPRLVPVRPLPAGSPGPRGGRPPAIARPLTTHEPRKGRDFESVRPLPLPAPAAIIGMGCLFPRADGLARYWANIRSGVDAITDVPETHWSADDYFDADPGPRPDLRPSGRIPRAGGLSTAGVRHRSPCYRGHRHHPAPRPAGRPPSAWRTPDTARAGRSIASASASSWASRGPSSWSSRSARTRQADLAAGARGGRRRRCDRRGRRPPHRRFLRRLAGEFVPRVAG